jgi:5-methylcytosine-specific restriction endonuclease McrA
MRKEGAFEHARRETRVFHFDRKSSSCATMATWRKTLVELQKGRCAGLLTAEGVYHPCFNPVFESSALDHIIELQYHGHDRCWNSQLLCTKCHDAKTRANRTSKACAILIRATIRANPEYRPSQPMR